MFKFEHTKLNQEQFEQFAHLLKHYKSWYATSKIDVGKIKVKLNLPLTAIAVFKKQRGIRISLHLIERVHYLLDVLTFFSIIAPVDKNPLSTMHTFIDPVITLKKGNHEKLHYVLIIWSLWETKQNLANRIACKKYILPRIKGLVFSIFDMNSAYNQMSLGKS